MEHLNYSLFTIIMNKSIDNPKNNLQKTDLIEESYFTYKAPLHAYFLYRLKDVDLANDFVQDVFLKLLDYRQILLKQTIKSFIYTIAHNLYIDYHRKYSKRMTISIDDLDYQIVESENIESILNAQQIEKIEMSIYNTLSPCRRKVYHMSRFNDINTMDIAKELKISGRTVENQLFTARSIIRTNLKKCI